MENFYKNIKLKIVINVHLFKKCKAHLDKKKH